MNQDLMIRLFRSIEGSKTDDIVKIAEKIVEEERKKGHVKLAVRLAEILEKNTIDTISPYKTTNHLRTLLTKEPVIPTDTRNNIPLATIIQRDTLRHEMVLPEELEYKIERIEREYVARERLEHFGLKPRHKVLLYGPPGCGKSMTAERIAWKIGLPFLKVRFEAVISSYLGESASNLKKLFDAIKTYPCVLLLDEFDFIAKTRNHSNDVGEMQRIVNILLNLLEDYDAPGILIATTNLENILDKALFRRFDDIIEFQKPGQNEIIGILKSTLSSLNTDKSVKLDKIAKEMDGFSAALVVKVANDAAKLAVIKGEQVIRESHFKQALMENSFYNK